METRLDRPSARKNQEESARCGPPERRVFIGRSTDARGAGSSLPKLKCLCRGFERYPVWRLFVRDTKGAPPMLGRHSNPFLQVVPFGNHQRKTRPALLSRPPRSRETLEAWTAKAWRLAAGDGSASARRPCERASGRARAVSACLGVGRGANSAAGLICFFVFAGFLLGAKSLLRDISFFRLAPNEK